jgi:hypothetical protein
MTHTERLLRSLGTIGRKRHALKAQEGRLDAEERKVMEAVSKMLAGVGYRIVAASARDTARGRPRVRRARKDLRCAKCDRRFGFEMHLARHMSAVHGAGRRAAKKKAG